MFLSVNQGPKGGSLESWSPEIFVVEPVASNADFLSARPAMGEECVTKPKNFCVGGYGAGSLSLLGVWTEMLILAK